MVQAVVAKEGRPLRLADLMRHGLEVIPAKPKYHGVLLECVVCQNLWFVKTGDDPDFLFTQWLCPNGCNN